MLPLCLDMGIFQPGNDVGYYAEGLSLLLDHGQGDSFDRVVLALTPNEAFRERQA